MNPMCPIIVVAVVMGEVVGSCGGEEGGMERACCVKRALVEMGLLLMG